VSYPNDDDKRLAAGRGDDPGGLIMIHGQVNGWGWLGWLGPFLYRTHGCIAVRNTAMEEIWNAVDDGTPIEIRP
jgi:murein L,D-transpeptidase YafK